MNVTRSMSITLLCLVLYAAYRDLIKSCKNRKRRKNAKDIVGKFVRLDLANKIAFCSKIIFALLFVYLFFRHFTILFAILSIPGVIIYILILVSALATAWKTVNSRGGSRLTSMESDSLALLGMFLAFYGLARSVDFDARYTGNSVTIIPTLWLAIEYSAYLFFIGSLVSFPIIDLSKGVKWCAARISTKFYATEEYVRRKAISQERQCKISKDALTCFRMKKGWIKWLFILPIVLAVVLDVLGYVFRYISILVLWMPLFCLLESLRILCRCVLILARRICTVSDRHMAVIAFRLAIVAAMLIVVTMNRFGLITTSDATTSVLEFIASVVIIPMLLEWIQEALSSRQKS